MESHHERIFFIIIKIDRQRIGEKDMTSFQQIILVIMVFVCVYALIDRICTCIERCATTTKMHDKFKENVKAADTYYYTSTETERKSGEDGYGK